MTAGDSTPSGPLGPLPLILVVDDSPVDRLLAGTLIAKKLGYRVVYACSGEEALPVCDKEKPTVVLTDLLLPGMNGLQLVEAIHRGHPHTPIVLLTAQGSEPIAMRALTSGAASYVPKKDLETDLVDTLEQVLGAAQHLQLQQRLQECVTRQEYEFVLDNDRSLIPVLVGFLQVQLGNLRLCDDTGRIRVGVALEEALLNAMYHGNLEVSSELRQEGDEVYHQLADSRRQATPYCDRRVHIDAVLSRDEAVFVVRDEGPGFPWSSIPDPTDPANLDKISGRGLLLIQTFMDDVMFNRTGNQITMIKRRQKPAQAED